MELIAAVCPKCKNGLNLENWKDSADMAYFREQTLGSTVIMGRKTYESIGHPLKDRHNIVISTNSLVEGVCVAKSIDDALFMANAIAPIGRTNGRIFIIGGAELYRATIANAKRLHITKISELSFLTTNTTTNEISGSKAEKECNCNIFFPNIPEGFHLEEVKLLKSGSRVHIYVRDPDFKISRIDVSYQALISKVLNEGVPIFEKYPIRALFSQRIQFTLSSVNSLIAGNKRVYEIPLLTTKKMFIKGIFYELLWFLRGDTNIAYLNGKGVHIWDKNAKNGDIGPGYGYQWMKWGGDSSLNQIKTIIHLLKTNPTNRRMVLSSWNVADLGKMALPPCHILYIFSTIPATSGGNIRLNCQLTMRSSDVLLGLPFNIMSVAFLVIFISILVGIEPGDIVLDLADTHIYEEHVVAIKEQLGNAPLRQPLLSFKKVPESFDDILNMDFSNLLIEYKSHPVIKAEMLVT